MPQDLLSAKKVKKDEFNTNELRGLGDSDFTWEVFENDIHFDGRKQFITVTGTEKLKQGIFNILVTPRGSIERDPEYGTSLPTLVGEKLTNPVFAAMQQEVIDALKHYNLINQNNPDPAEVIQLIDTVEVVQDLDEPRAIKVKVSVISEAGESIDIVSPQIS